MTRSYSARAASMAASNAATSDCRFATRRVLPLSPPNTCARAERLKGLAGRRDAARLLLLPFAWTSLAALELANDLGATGQGGPARKQASKSELAVNLLSWAALQRVGS